MEPGNENGDWPGIGQTLRDGEGNVKYYDPYCFSIEYSDYHPWAQQNLIPGAKDVFYDLNFNRVYTMSQFHDHSKHQGRRQFLGIKEILPEQDQQCSTTAMFFPINSAVRRVKAIIILNQFIIIFLQMLYVSLTASLGLIASVLGIIMSVFVIIYAIICLVLKAINAWGWLASMINAPPVPTLCGQLSTTNQCAPSCLLWGLPMGFVLFTLRQKKYPECEQCMCRTNVENLQGGQSEMMDITTGYGWNGDDCAGSTTLLGQERDVVCCPDDYGFNSSSTNTTNDYAAGGGCYVKPMCVNMYCLDFNVDITVISEWARRQKIASALCDGIMNYFWENAWVNGFLYQFQFKAKLSYDASNDTYATSGTRYCKKVVYMHPNDHTFYYRCTPFKYTSSTGGKFIGDTDGVRGGSSSDDRHSSGDMDRHILFPTTMVDMGSRNQCIQQICLDEKFAEECSVTDQIGSTSFQDITDLVSDIYNLKASNPGTLLNDLFVRPEKEIEGDVAQALMQNCMLGVYGYETNMSSTNCDCTTPATATTESEDDIQYPPPNNMNVTGLPYEKYAINANSQYTILWEPHLFTASTPTIMTGADLIDCMSYELSGSSQEVPYYLWLTPAGGFGNRSNDWMFTWGDYPSPQNWAWTITGGTTLINSGEYQNDVGALNMMGPNAYPPMNPNSGPAILFSQPLFYYFGLRPGATAYNTFIRLYIDAELSENVV